VFLKGPIVRQPNPARELAVGPEDKKLILKQIFPAMREMEGQDEAMN